MSTHWIALRSAMVRPYVTRLACAAAMLFGFAGAHADQLLVTAANSDGNSIYDLTRATSSALISGTSAINTDSSKHGLFESLVWVPNSVTGSLALIESELPNQQIVRYSGPTYDI